MEEKKRKTMQQLYETACNNYLKAFAEKHGFCVSDCDWVAGMPGGVASCGDYMVDMQTIKDDIDTDAPEEEFVKWYDYTMDCAENGLPDCNFRSWLKGCPRHSQETFDRLRELRKDVEEAKRMLDAAIEEEKGKLF